MTSIVGTILKSFLYKGCIPKFKGEVVIKKENLPPISQECLSLISGQPIIIKRDKHGVFHIVGESKNDVIFAQGWCIGQERLFQMETFRRMAFGRLGEMGKDFVLMDKFIRTLGIHTLSKNDAEKIKQKGIYKDDFERMTCFVGGINAFIKSKRFKKPAEAKLLGLNLEEFKIADICGVFRLLSLEMYSCGWLAKLVYAELEKIISKDDASAIRKGQYITDNTPHWKSGKSMDFVELLKIEEKMNTENKGSNCWVISGKHTASGKPILCSDPHLETGNPSIWMQYHLTIKNKNGEILENATGNAFAPIWGLQYMHNDHMSFGVTLASTDSYEIYEEKISCDMKESWYDGKWIKIEEHTETIKRKGSKPLKLKVYKTKNGPLLSSVFNEMNDYQGKLSKKKKNSKKDEDLNQLDSIGGKKYVTHYSIRGVAFDPIDGPITQMTNSWTIKNFFDLVKSGQTMHKFGLNLVYGDKEGNIGYSMTGLIPNRSQEAIDKFYNRPVPGWEPKYQWKGYIPTTENPKQYNPKCGYIISCNQKIVDDSYPHYLGRLFFPEVRAKRIETMIKNQIDNGKKLTIEYNKKIQLDVKLDNTDFICKKMMGIYQSLEENTSAFNKIFKQHRRKSVSKELMSECAKRIQCFSGECKNEPKPKKGEKDTRGGALLYNVFEWHLLKTLLESNKELKNRPALIRAVLGCGIAKSFYSWNSFSSKNCVISALIINNDGENSLIKEAGGIEVVVFKALLGTIKKIRSLGKSLKIAKSKKKKDIDRELAGYMWQKFHKVQHIGGNGMFVEEFESTGSRDTVFATPFFGDGESFNANASSSLRMIIDFADLNDNCSLIFCPGNAANPASPHYNDNMKKYELGEYNKLISDPKEIDESPGLLEETLILKPQKGLVKAK